MAPAAGLVSLDSAAVHKVWEVRTLGHERDAEARRLLEDAAAQVQPIMRARRWRVALLTEFSPRNASLLGLNVNGGQEVRIRLRRPGRDSGFFPYEHVLGTLLHELVHIEHGPHDAKFYKLLDDVTKDCDELVAKGIRGTGQGFDAPGRRLGGFNRSLAPASVRDAVRAAAERRFVAGRAMPAGPQRLGGDSSLAKLLPPAQAAAMAAERRRDDDQWCAGASTASAAPGEEVTVRLQAAEREQQAAALTPSSAERNAGRERDEVGGTGRQLWESEQPLERQEGDRSWKRPNAEAGVEDCEGMWACGACTLLNRPIWPFWRRKRKVHEHESRLLTRRIVELGKRRQLDQVFEELEGAKKRGVPINLISMNAVLAACVHSDKVDKALEVFRDMTAAGCVGADSVTYGTLIKGLGQAKRLDDAFELLESMEKGTAPGRPQLNVVHINTLINACAEAGDALRARGILQRYRTFGQGSSGPSTFTYNLLIKVHTEIMGYARSDNPLEALKIANEMRLLGLPLQRVTYNSLILACVRGWDFDKALDFLDEMKSEARRLKTSRLLPDVVTYTTLLKGLAEDGDLDSVLAIAQEMKATPTCVIDRVAYSAIVDACITAGSPNDGLLFLAEMEAEAENDPSLRPRAHVFLALLRALAPDGAHCDTCRKLADRMIMSASGTVWPEDRAEADELVLEATINAGQMKEATLLLRKMISSARTLVGLTKRGVGTLVKLMTFSDAAVDDFKPLVFHPEAQPRSTVRSIMKPLSTLKPLPLSTATVGKVVLRFLSSSFVPVLDDKGQCQGILEAQKCKTVESSICDAMTPLPPAVSADDLLQRAATLMLQEGVELLTVVDRSAEWSSLPAPSGRKVRNGQDGSEEESHVVGFISKADIFCSPASEPAMGKSTLSSASKAIKASEQVWVQPNAANWIEPGFEYITRTDRAARTSGS
eukprot:SM000213S06829  [mRNA]  locus=s213:204039:211980:- [translate_table: standard]